MRSKLFAGNVRHRRRPPHGYAFTYGVFYLCLDLDEIDAVDRRLRLLSRNRLNVVSFYDRDHMPRAADDVRVSIRQHLAVRGIDAEGCTIGLLTNGRVMNYVFNPVSFFFVRREGELQHVIAEVHNTHGERHLYDLVRQDGAGSSVYTSAAVKDFYVSPFINMDAHYVFRVADNGALDIRIDEYRGEELFFQADLRVAPRPLTDANITRMLVRYPLVTVKTIALIHWHGLKLWLRGERYRKHTPRTEQPR